MRIFRRSGGPKSNEGGQHPTPPGMPERLAPELDLVPLQGREQVKAVGESHYQEALSLICGGKTPDGTHLDVIATLQPEPSNPYDPNAVAVLVRGLLVGYLARAEAAALHGEIAALSAQRPVTCRARVRGGWLHGTEEGFFGVELYFGPPPLQFRP